jgi:hypothetical protein
VDLYRGVHKGLRAFLARAVLDVGALDPADTEAWPSVARSIETLLSLLEQHLSEEQAFVEAAIDARAPRRAPTTTHEHEEHRTTLAAVRSAVDAVSRAPRGARAERIHGLYLALADLAAESFVHMRREETENNALLWRHYDDEELRGIEHALVSQIPPEAMMHFLAWMIPSLHHGERVELLGGMRAGAPREVFDEVLGLARTRLDPTAFERLLGLLDEGRSASADLA